MTETGDKAAATETGLTVDDQGGRTAPLGLGIATLADAILVAALLEIKTACHEIRDELDVVVRKGESLLPGERASCMERGWLMNELGMKLGKRAAELSKSK